MYLAPEQIWLSELGSSRKVNRQRSLMGKKMSVFQESVWKNDMVLMMMPRNIVLSTKVKYNKGL